MALAYHKQVFRELLNKDALVVMGPGMGMRSVLVKLVRLYASQERLVLVLNATSEAGALNRALRDDGVPQQYLPRSVTSSLPVAEREKVYAARGCVLVTSRIIVVDFLGGRLAPASVAGVIVHHADK